MGASLARALLLCAFFLSGSSGLIYQTVWVRMLTRYLGATTHATATVLIVFMAGLALGSLASAQWADRSKQPLRVYVILELAIGVSGLLTSFALIDGLSDIYVQLHQWLGASQATLLTARVVFVLLALSLPTLLMGATLPLLVVFVARRGQDFQTSLGGLYAVNTWGAACGALAAGLVLIGAFGETATLAVAALLNALAALLGVVLWRRNPSSATGTEDAVPAPPADDGLVSYPPWVRRLALATLFVSGLTALAYEVLWSRLLVLLLRTSIYAFSTMLATFLAGIALGSGAAASRRFRQAPLATVAWLEVLIGWWAAVGLLLLVPLAQLQSGQTNPGLRAGLGLLACLVVVFPVAFCFGLQFPVAVRCCLQSSGAPGQTAGQAYTVNTLGTIVGALAAGFFLIPLLGVSTTILALAAVNGILGLVLYAAAPRGERSGRLTAGLGVLALLFAGLLPLVGDPYLRVMAARVRGDWGDDAEIFAYFERSEATTVAAGNRPNPLQRALLINGVGMTFLCTETKLMTHLPYLLAQRPRRLLVICVGMGTTLRSASLYPDLQIDAVDIVPEVFDCLGYFHHDMDRVLRHPAGLKLHADDGRNFLLTHPEPFDIITVDPAPPLHSAGTVNLYTREFFQLCKSRLTPGGVLCMWLLPAPESEALMVLKAFHDVFPDGSVWGALDHAGFYLIGGHRPLGQTPTQVAAVAEKLSQIEELGEWGTIYRDPAKLRQLYLLDGPGLAPLLAQVPTVTDNHPYTEFPLWRRLRAPDGTRILNAERVRERASGTHFPR